VDVVEFACGIPSLLMGRTLPDISRNVDSYSVLEPLGVVVGIPPFNFPAMIPLWMMPLAVACGNAFILKPAEKAPAVPKPVVPVDPRVKAQKSVAVFDQLAALRDVDMDKFAKNQPKTTDPGDVSVVSRDIISSKVGGTSGGISAPTSSGLAAGSGSLRGIYTTQVKDPNLGASGQGATRGGGSGKPSRSADEIALVFTKNKGAIDAMYARALRDNPALQGKVVLELTIAPSGDITAARIVSSELGDKEFESKLLARIRLFKFEAKDVATLTATKPIDFFPAG